MARQEIMEVLVSIQGADDVKPHWYEVKRTAVYGPAKLRHTREEAAKLLEERRRLERRSRS
jgi:hypothetical protein